MEIYQHLGNFLDNYGSPFFVGSLVEKKVLFVNQKAKTMFGCTEETCDFEKIFERTEERMEILIAKGLKEEKNALYYNFIALTANQEKIVVDLQFGFFNAEKTEMFLEIIPQNDTRLQMAQHQIQNSPRAEAILNFDENLSIFDCNKAFQKVFEFTEEQTQSQKKNYLVSGISPEVRERLLTEIHKTLETSEIFSTEIKVCTLKGEKKWYRFDLQKRELDNSGLKLMCYMVNIEKEVKRKEENDLLNQYLSIMQESSADILYRVNTKENTMYHFSDFITAGGKEKAISNYVEVFMSGSIIHPEDKQAYLQSFQDFYENDTPPNVPIRFSLDDGPYRWYHIVGKKLFNSQGELVEVFGALINVDKEIHLKEEFSAVHNYFEAFQKVSDESFCVIHLAEKTLTQKGNVAKELGITEVLQNFPECAYSFIHPEDLPNFTAFTEESILGDAIRVQTRMKTQQGDYQWYELRSQGITDNQGNITEIVGTINNIQKRKTMQAEIVTMQKYFDVLQEFTEDILYRVDVPTNTLYHSYQRNALVLIDPEVPNYLETFLKDQIIHPDDAETFLRNTKEWHQDETVVCKVRLRLFDEKYQWYTVKRRKVYDNLGELVEIVGALVNIQREHEMQLDYSILNQYFSAMQDLSVDVLFHIDIETMTFHHNDKKASKLGLSYNIDDFVNTLIDENIIHPDCHESYRNDVKDMISGRKMDYHVLSLSKPGVYEWYHVQGRFIRNDQGQPVEIFGKMKNVQAQRNLEQRAYHDMMTGALNKSTFEEQSKKVLESTTTDENHALIFIDLDDFKKVNDTLGHAFGDALLTTVGKRLKRLIRGDDLVGRIGGDEFAVLLRNVDSQESVLGRTQLMLEAMQKDFSFEEKIVGIKASVGVSVYPHHGKTYKDLIHKADIAVYESKRRGKNVTTLYRPDLKQH